MAEENTLEVPEGMNPEEMPPELRINVLMNELLMMVDHMTNLRTRIDDTMKELMEGVHEHGPECDHDEEE